MKKVAIHPQLVEDPKRRGGEVLIVQPDEDLVVHDGTEFIEGESVNVVIPSPDGAEWETTGVVVQVDRDDTPTLVMVRVNWGQATLVA